MTQVAWRGSHKGTYVSQISLIYIWQKIPYLMMSMSGATPVEWLSFQDTLKLDISITRKEYGIVHLYCK